MSDDFGEIETLRQGSRKAREVEPAKKPRGRLLIMGHGTSTTFDLPESGELAIGRAPGAEVRIDDPSISRRHALLRIGPTIRVEDLGSANGTFVGEVRIEPGEPAEVLPGDTIEVGSFTLVVQYPSSGTARLRRILPHGYFESRLEEECARAERTGSSLAVGRLHVGAGIEAEKVNEIVGAELRSDEPVAAYGPGELEFLLTDTTPERASESGRRILDRIRGLGGDEPPRLGLAVYPRDGRSPEVLFSVACDGARGARPEPRTAGQVVVESPAMQRLHHLIEKVAQGSISVLILGETGVGKEVTAEMIHRRSPRAEKPFVRLNCAALSESLIESELFGYEKGAFTGAVRDKQGLIETAQGGTLFLDEVGELPMSTQVKLLRVLEERMVLRVGGLKPRAVDIRVVSATNRDLEAEIVAGRFRQDLYFRLNGITLTVPPLRERTEEIASLARLFVGQICRQDNRPSVPAISSEAMRHLAAYRWPGNIRELRNVIERAVLLSGGDRILPEHLPLEKMAPGGVARAAPPPPAQAPAARPEPAVSVEEEDDDEGPSDLMGELQDIERERILQALERCNGNQSQAARMLGIARRTLIKRLDRYQIERPRKGKL